MATITGQDEFEVRFIRTPEQYAIGVRIKVNEDEWSDQILLTAGQTDQFIDALTTARDRSRRAAMRELAKEEGADDDKLEALLNEALPIEDDEV